MKLAMQGTKERMELLSLLIFIFHPQNPEKFMDAVRAI